MKNMLLLAALLPAIALAQDSQTNCYTYGEGSTQCRTTERQVPQVNAPDVVGAYQRGAQIAAQEQAVRQQAELIAAERRNVELQNQQLQQQIDQRQRAIAAEAAVVRQALVAFVEEQAALPVERRIRDETETAKRIAAIAQQMLGHEPSNEAFAMAAAQLRGAQEKP
jgi:hypothetical protein